MMNTLPTVPEIIIANPRDLDERLRTADRPFIARGLVSDWPLVVAGRRSAGDARDYLLQRCRDRPFVVSVGQPAGGDRLSYDQDMRMNFRTGDAKLPEIFRWIDEAAGIPDAPAIYLGSIDVRDFFVGLHDENHVDLGDRSCLAKIWIGTRTRVGAHNDTPHNLGCVAVGHRRFTLFPREQFANLYLGPPDNTPAGRSVSMVDFQAPDFDAYPRFREALRHAQVAELEAGDAIFIPALWWHHVEALDPFNVLVNYWWSDTPAWLGTPENALMHAMMAIRDLPEDRKTYWREMFDHYVFDNGDEVVDHIPPDARGVLAPLNPQSAGRIRNFLLRRLSQ